MSSYGLKTSGIPNNVYVFPLDVVLLITSQLGVAIGQLDFAQPFKSAENIINLIKTLLEYKKQGLLIRQYPKYPVTPVTTQLNLDAISKIMQISEGQTFLIKTFDKNSSTNLEEGEVVFERPLYIKPNQTYRELPSLFALKPSEDKNTNPMLMYITESVKEREALDGEPVLQLDTVGRYHDVVNTICSLCGFKGHQARFMNQSEIQNSIYRTQDVGKNYYNITKKILYKKWLELAIILQTNMVLLCKEMQGFDYEGSEGSQKDWED